MVRDYKNPTERELIQGQFIPIRQSIRHMYPNSLVLCRPNRSALGFDWDYITGDAPVKTKSKGINDDFKRNAGRNVLNKIISTNEPMQMYFKVQNEKLSDKNDKYKSRDNTIWIDLSKAIKYFYNEGKLEIINYMHLQYDNPNLHLPDLPDISYGKYVLSYINIAHYCIYAYIYNFKKDITGNDLTEPLFCIDLDYTTLPECEYFDKYGYIHKIGIDDGYRTPVLRERIYVGKGENYHDDPNVPKVQLDSNGRPYSETVGIHELISDVLITPHSLTSPNLSLDMKHHMDDLKLTFKHGKKPANSVMTLNMLPTSYITSSSDENIAYVRGGLRQSRITKIGQKSTIVNDKYLGISNDVDKKIYDWKKNTHWETRDAILKNPPNNFGIVHRMDIPNVHLHYTVRYRYSFGDKKHALSYAPELQVSVFHEGQQIGENDINLFNDPQYYNKPLMYQLNKFGALGTLFKIHDFEYYDTLQTIDIVPYTAGVIPNPKTDAIPFDIAYKYKCGWAVFLREMPHITKKTQLSEIDELSRPYLHILIFSLNFSKIVKRITVPTELNHCAAFRLRSVVNYYDNEMYQQLILIAHDHFDNEYHRYMEILRDSNDIHDETETKHLYKNEKISFDYDDDYFDTIKLNKHMCITKFNWKTANTQFMQLNHAQYNSHMTEHMFFKGDHTFHNTLHDTEYYHLQFTNIDITNIYDICEVPAGTDLKNTWVGKVLTRVGKQIFNKNSLTIAHLSKFDKFIQFGMHIDTVNSDNYYAYRWYCKYYDKKINEYRHYIVKFNLVIQYGLTAKQLLTDNVSIDKSIEIIEINKELYHMSRLTDEFNDKALIVYSDIQYDEDAPVYIKIGTLNINTIDLAPVNLSNNASESFIDEVNGILLYPKRDGDLISNVSVTRYMAQWNIAMSSIFINVASTMRGREKTYEFTIQYKTDESDKPTYFYDAFLRVYKWQGVIASKPIDAGNVIYDVSPEQNANFDEHGIPINREQWAYPRKVQFPIKINPNAFILMYNGMIVKNAHVNPLNQHEILIEDMLNMFYYSRLSKRHLEPYATKDDYLAHNFKVINFTAEPMIVDGEKVERECYLQHEPAPVIRKCVDGVYAKFDTPVYNDFILFNGIDHEYHILDNHTIKYGFTPFGLNETIGTLNGKSFRERNINIEKIQFVLKPKPKVIDTTITP